MQRVKATLRQIPLLTLGTFLVAAGVYFFKFPNHFNTGGVTGLAVILNAVVPTVSRPPSPPSSTSPFWCWASSSWTRASG